MNIAGPLRACAIALGLLAFSTICPAQSATRVAVPAVVDSGNVRAAARLADGSYIIGGRFDRVSGVRRTSVARIKPDGTLDPTWNPVLDGNVSAIVVTPDEGHVYLAGDFANANGIATGGLVKLQLGGWGDVEPSWSPVAFTGSINAMVAGADQRLYAGGDFQLTNSPIARLARFDIAGTPDPTWQPAIFGPIHTLATDASSHLYVGGTKVFTTNAGSPGFTLGRIDMAGPAVRDPTWNIAPLLAAAPEFSSIQEIALDAQQDVYFSGAFTQVNGVLRSLIAKATADGQVGTWTAAVASSAVALQPVGSWLYVAQSDRGLFPDEMALPDLVRFDGATGIADGNFSIAVDGDVNQLAAMPDGIAVVGNFAAIAGQSMFGMAGISAVGDVSRIAPDIDAPARVYEIVSGANGTAVIAGNFERVGTHYRGGVSRLLADGQVDASFAPPRANYPVRAIAIDSASGAIYIGGEFSHLGTVPRERIAKLSGADGALDETFAGSASGDVQALAVDQDSRLLVGGSFNYLSGAVRNRFGRLSTTGVADYFSIATSDPQFPTVITSIVPRSDGMILVGGRFQLANNSARPGAALLKPPLVANGVGWVEPWSPPFGWHATVSALASVGNVAYVAGRYSNGQQSILTLEGDSATIKHQLFHDSSVNVLLELGEGDLIAAGHFQTMDGQPRSKLARLIPTDAGLVVHPWYADLGSSGTVYGAAVLGNGTLLAGGEGLSIDADQNLALVGFNGTDAQEPANDAPQFTDASFDVFEGTLQGTVVGTLQASDDGLPQPPGGLTYTAVGLTGPFDVSSSGQIVVSGPLLEAGYAFNVEVTDGAATDAALITITVVDPLLFRDSFE